MTTITKSALANELGVTPSRVSQYVKMGLPVRSDGKLNRDEALKWLKLSAVGLNTFEDRGVNRAGRLAKGPTKRLSKAEPAPEPAEPDTFAIVADLVARSGSIAAHMAIEAGATLQVAYALDQAVTVHLWNAAEDAFGIPRGSVSPFEAMVNDRIIEPDWPALADRACEELDLDALDAFADAMPSLQPPAAPEGRP